MIDWPVLNKSYPWAVAFAIDSVGMAWLFGDVPVFLADGWRVNQGVQKMALGLINPIPSGAASSLIIREDRQPTGFVSTYEPTGPEPLKQGEKPKQVEPTHAKGWATSDPAPVGMHAISDAEASGAQLAVTRSVTPGVTLNDRITPPTVSTVNPAQIPPVQPKPATNLMLTKVVLDLVEALPPGKRREQLLALLNHAG